MAVLRSNTGVIESNGQANKSTGRMPWHQEPKKDAASCEKPRLGANSHRPVDIRMGEPTRGKCPGTYT
jgi:hypothetical protein